mgnify:CR=1 FL=1
MPRCARLPALSRVRFFLGIDSALAPALASAIEAQTVHRPGQKLSPNHGGSYTPLRAAAKAARF